MTQRPLTERDIETLAYLTNPRDPTAAPWHTPLDLGAYNGSHHSGTLAKLAKRGLVQFKQRGTPDPDDGENGKKIWRGRGSKTYRITAAGKLALTGKEGTNGPS